MMDGLSWNDVVERYYPNSKANADQCEREKDRVKKNVKGLKAILSKYRSEIPHLQEQFQQLGQKYGEVDPHRPPPKV